MIERVSDSGRGRWIAPVLVLLVGAVAYSDSFEGPLIFDDVATIRDNPQIRSLIPYRVHSDLNGSSSRPVTAFTFALNYAIAGPNVEIYHATNLLIHLASSLLLFAIARRTLQKYTSSSTWLAALIAGVWVAHPLTTQAVTYIVERVESLSSFFILGSIYCVIRSASGVKGWGIAAVVSCALGMGSKEIAVVVPILALLYDRTFIAGSFSEALRKRWRIYCGMVASWAILWVCLRMGGGEGVTGFGLGITPFDWARTELNVIARYIRLAVWPSDLVLDYYGWPLAVHWSGVNWQGWGVLGLAGATLVALKFRPWLGFLGAWFFLILSPTSSFYPLKVEVAAEQRMYLPLAAIIVLAVVVGWKFARRWKWSRAAYGLAGCLTITLLGGLTFARNAQYSSALEIWADTVAKQPGNARARLDYGQAWAQESAEFPPGSTEAIAAAGNAAEQFRAVLAIDPKVGKAALALGQSLEHMGEPGTAEELYTQSIGKYPDMAEQFLLARGNLRGRRDDWNGAAADFTAAIRVAPLDDEAHYFLGLVYLEENNAAAAAAQLETAVKLNPDNHRAADQLNRLNQTTRPVSGTGQ